MKCPVCEETDLVMSERQEVEIDYCPKCRGVWLDRGELDKIIERSTQGTASSARPGYQHDASHASHHRPKKKEGFLSELFDFEL